MKKELPVHDVNRRSLNRQQRSPEDVHALAVAIQANLVQLKVAALKRAPEPANISGIDVASPGAVINCREALLLREVIKAYSDEQLLLCLHEAWGQYCMMCWAQEPSIGCRLQACATTDFGSMPEQTTLRCEAVLKVKEAEIHALLWRLRFEQRLRHDELFPRERSFEHYQSLAKRIPATALGKPAKNCDDQTLGLGICQHAGMLETIRWIIRPAAVWQEPALLEVAELPF